MAGSDRRPRLLDVMNAEALRNERDGHALIGRLRGRSALRALRTMSDETAIQMALCLQAAKADPSRSLFASVHSPDCRILAVGKCRCAVLVLVPGAEA